MNLIRYMYFSGFKFRNIFFTVIFMLNQSECFRLSTTMISLDQQYQTYAMISPIIY